MSIRSGYFDAQWNASTEDYDIKYSTSDFNTYLKGIINQNGVFNTIRTVGDPSIGTKDYAPFEIEVGTGMEIYVHAGKAMVNGHWVVLTEGQSVTFEAADQAVVRRDGLVLRYNQATRDITLVAKKGIPSTEGINDIYPEGYNYVTKEFFGVNQNNIAEIMLAWVDIQPRHTQINKSWIQSRIGNSECPWITHVLVGPSAKDVDTYLAMMKDSFDAWFADTQDRLQINTNITRYYKSVMSQGATSTKISLSNMKVVPSYEDSYSINDDDIVTIYYNGLAIVDNTDNKNWILSEEDGVPYITLQWIPANAAGNYVIPKGNNVDIVIERSRLGGIANCINEYY